MEKYSIYLKKFKVAIGIIVFAFIVCIFMIVQTVPQVQKILNLQEQYKIQSSSLADSERRLTDLKAEASRKQAEIESVAGMFFKPVNTGLDTEASISDEFAEILQIMRDNKIKTRSVTYDYDPEDDNFVKNMSYKYHVCRVNAEIVANYSEFANFLRELYKHEHFLDISKIEILPYQKNKRILLVSLQFKLYAQKEGAVAPAPKPAAEEAGEAASGDSVPSPEEEDAP